MGFLLALINPLSAVVRDIAKAKIAMANAQTDQERIHAEERIKSLEAKRDVLVAEAAVSKFNIYVRGSIGSAVAVLLWKVLVYDKALGQWTGGHTDPLDANLWQVVSVVLGFYFLYEGAIGVTRILKR